jgi:hypothetical protein
MDAQARTNKEKVAFLLAPLRPVLPPRGPCLGRSLLNLTCPSLSKGNTLSDDLPDSESETYPKTSGRIK